MGLDRPPDKAGGTYISPSRPPSALPSPDPSRHFPGSSPASRPHVHRTWSDRVCGRFSTNYPTISETLNLSPKPLPPKRLHPNVGSRACASVGKPLAKGTLGLGPGDFGPSKGPAGPWARGLRPKIETGPTAKAREGGPASWARCVNVPRNLKRVCGFSATKAAEEIGK